MAGGILGGLTKGFERGIALDAQFISSMIWAVEHSPVDPQPLKELIVIGKQNVSELIDVTGNILPAVIGALITGGDPTAGSRHAYEAWKAKWKH